MELGLFSISYAGLWGQAALDLRAVVRRAAELGFDAVMLAGKRPHLSPLDFDVAAIAVLRDDLKTAGVRCPVVAAYVDLGGAVAAEVPFLEMQIGYVEGVCRIGAQLGAKFVRVFTAYETPGCSVESFGRVTGSNVT
jgi:sugar phosphate isomerase/epimerase